MNPKIDNLAVEIALLSNSSLKQLAEALVEQFPTRADALTFMMQTVVEDNLREIHRQLGIL